MVNSSIMAVLGAGFMLGLIVAGFAVLLMVLIKPVRIGFKTKSYCVESRWFSLTEVSALMRLQFLERCSKFEGADGFKLFRKDLAISADLIALHQRRWFIPHWFLVLQVKRMPGETIAELFRHCVKLSSIPFAIEETVSDDELVVAETVSESVAETETVAEVDDFDYPNDGKKPPPADSPQ